MDNCIEAFLCSSFHAKIKHSFMLWNKINAHNDKEKLVIYDPQKIYRKTKRNLINAFKPKFIGFPFILRDDKTFLKGICI